MSATPRCDFVRGDRILDSSADGRALSIEDLNVMLGIQNIDIGNLPVIEVEVLADGSVNFVDEGVILRPMPGSGSLYPVDIQQVKPAVAVVATSAVVDAQQRGGISPVSHTD